MESKKEELLNEKAEIEQEIASKEAEIGNLNIHNDVAKTKAERVINDKEIARLNDEIIPLKQRLASVTAQIAEFKRFNRDRFIANLDYLLANSDKKLGALETESGNNPGYISRMKSGKSPSDPSIEFLMTVSDELNVPLEMLVGSNLTELSATEKFILNFLRKVKDDTLNDTLTWSRETVAELENMDVEYDYQGNPYSPHPLYDFREKRTEDDYFAYLEYSSLFYKNCGVKPCNNCYHAQLLPTDQNLYIMECGKGDDRLIWRNDRFFEFYIVTFNQYGGSTVQKLCNTLEVSSPNGVVINELVKAVIMSLTRVHIDTGVKNAINEYMNGVAPSSGGNEELPFN